MEDKEAILQYVLKNCPLKVFNKYLEEYNIRGIFERRKREIMAMWFDNSELKYSVQMNKIFDLFQTTKNEQSAKLLDFNMRMTLNEIKSKRKFKLNTQDLVIKYNLMVSEKNELNKDLINLTNLYKETHKNGQLKN